MCVLFLSADGDLIFYLGGKYPEMRDFELSAFSKAFLFLFSSSSCVSFALFIVRYRLHVNLMFLCCFVYYFLLILLCINASVSNLAEIFFLNNKVVLFWRVYIDFLLWILDCHARLMVFLICFWDFGI